MDEININVKNGSKHFKDSDDDEESKIQATKLSMKSKITSYK